MWNLIHKSQVGDVIPQYDSRNYSLLTRAMFAVFHEVLILLQRNTKFKQFYDSSSMKLVKKWWNLSFYLSMAPKNHTPVCLMKKTISLLKVLLMSTFESSAVKILFYRTIGYSSVISYRYQSIIMLQLVIYGCIYLETHPLPCLLPLTSKCSGKWQIDYYAIYHAIFIGLYCREKCGKLFLMTLITPLMWPILMVEMISYWHRSIYIHVYIHHLSNI